LCCTMAPLAGDVIGFRELISFGTRLPIIVSEPSWQSLPRGAGVLAAASGVWGHYPTVRGFILGLVGKLR
jgi:hypothetical protein